MSEERDGGRRKASAFALSEWSLRRKLALALAVPMILAAALGGLRVNGELGDANNYLAASHQVKVIRPAVAYLSAAEQATIISRQHPTLDDPDRQAAIDAVKQAGAVLDKSRSGAQLTSKQSKELDVVLDLSVQLRTGDGYVSPGQSVSQIRQLHTDVIQLINTVIDAQIDPEPKLSTLQQVLDGRVSLSNQQFQVAYPNKSVQADPVQLASQLGVEQAAIDRLGAALGSTQKDVLALSQQNAQHFGVVAGGGHDLGDATAFAPYDTLSKSLLDGIDSDLSAAANHSRELALLNAAITLAALVAAVLLALLVSRLVLTPIQRVREGALKVANTRLPEEVARIRAGGEVSAVTPIDVTSREEVGQLARAVDELHQQAINLAAAEAKTRAQVSDMFVTLSRRNTSLVNQQLGLIERLESDEEDPQRLESLFRLDHLASRMRRTAESLVVLSDAPVATSDAALLPVSDALQAAIAGVQDYQRVQITTSPTERINGSAVGDVVHLLTELVDNALAYSPPTAPVVITTGSSRAGVLIQIADAGLGIPADEVAAMNAELKSGGEVTADTARRMGLLVVSRLARRHGISVSLDHNDRGGTTASVRLPASILRDVSQANPVPEPSRVPSTPTVVTPSAPSGSTESSATVAETISSNGHHPTGGAPEMDQIEAAINAVIRLPQRQPGTSDLPGAPAASTASGEGGSLFLRFAARNDAKAETEAPTEESTVEEPAAAVPAVEAEPAPDPEPDPEPVAEAAPEPEREPDLEPTPVPASLAPASLAHLSARAEADSLATAESLTAQPTIPAAVFPTGLVSPVPAPATFVARAAHEVLDSANPMPDTGEDEPPIFRSMRSNWFSPETETEEWSTSEVDAGWQAAERVAEAPALQLSESGLPVRRPGNRLVPGGVTPAAAPATRDPEAIRARLAAHAAGVSRGRTAAADHDVHDPAEQEVGPA